MNFTRMIFRYTWFYFSRLACTLVLKAVCMFTDSIIYPSKISLFRNCFRIWIHTTPGTAGCDFGGVFLLMFVQKSFLTFGIKKRPPCQNFRTACSTFCHCGGDFHRGYNTWTDSCHFWIYEIFWRVFWYKKVLCSLVLVLRDEVMRDFVLITFW